MRPITATYRLQLHKGFGFGAARAIVDYLDDLGISHAYSSPITRAEEGSTHGYNLVDPKELNPELGSNDEFVAWTDALAAREMGHIVDVVPNHMSASTRNPWWLDVLENGPSSIYADHFDIEWHPPKAALENKVLLPILGAQYGEVLERGELKLERDGGAFVIRYWDHRLPANPRSVWPLLERAARRSNLPSSDARRQELESIVTGLKNLPPRTETDRQRQEERAREKEILKRRLARLAEDTTIACVIDDEVTAANGTPDDPTSFDELDRLLMEQSYRLAFWRVATDEINYRRFFDINDLAAVRMECDAVFDDAHALLLRLIEAGRVSGVRLDHTDGLYDPAGYFSKLRQEIVAANARGGRGDADIYIVAEKILASGEALASGWPIEGTTGYDFLVSAAGVFVDRAAESAFTRLAQEITGDGRPFEEHATYAKRTIMRSSLSSEMHMLATRLERIAMRDRRSRDYTFSMLRRAVIETIAAFPVYRTYIRPDGSREPRDEHIVTRATQLARRRNPELSPSVFGFLRDVLLLRGKPLDEADHKARTEFAMRFQQLTGPVMAKSVEDTAFYTYVRFVALNEVGGTPDRFGTTIAEFHADSAARARSWPRTMCATATHDTKRGEDVRARLAVLTEIPDAWARWVRDWRDIATRYVSMVEDEPSPSAADQYLFFQTAIGAHPLGDDAGFENRLTEYAIKAAREAKQHTSWLSPVEPYEQALRGFISGMLSDATFRSSLAAKAETIATYGASNGLALTLVKVASPGVPDTYQGSELWDLRLVDPDNRNPVDFDARRAALRSLEGFRLSDLLASFRDGRIKLHALREGLRLRRQLPLVFSDGGYTPIDAGEDALAFLREHASGAVVCAVTRRPYHATRGLSAWAIGDLWGERELAVPNGTWRDVLTGKTHTSRSAGLLASKLFADLPVALLARSSP